MSSKIKIFLTILTVCFFAVFLFAFLNRTGSLILFWKEEPIGGITHDEGFGYYSYIQDENISRLKLPLYLKEDHEFLDFGPLSVNEDYIASIKVQGGGRYLIQENNDLYFSATDGNPQNHDYSTVSPIIIRSRFLIMLFIPVLLLTAADLFLYIKNKDLTIIKNSIYFTGVILLLITLLPWDRMIFPAVPFSPGPGSLLLKPLLQRNVFYIGSLFIILALITCLHRESKLLRILSIVSLIVCTVYYFIPEWNWYGLRADSPAYLEPYTASSIRTPGYPSFISAAAKLSGTRKPEIIQANDDRIISERLQDGKKDGSKELLNVVRAQKCILGFSFLIFFALFRYCCDPFWFGFASQIILCGGFLGVDNSYIMTECLSQAAILLAAAMFLLTIKKKSVIPFLLLCLVSAAGVLIRPANIFLTATILIGFVYLIYTKREILIPVLGCLAFLALCAIPAITIYREYGIFVWMPTSGYVEIARAADLMEPGDEEAFEDPEARELCREMLELKKQYPDADQNTNMWQVGVAAALKRGYNTITCSPIFGKISRKIFQLHFSEFINAILANFKTAMERTRLQFGPISFAALFILFTILFVLHISENSLLGMVLVFLHIGHLCISMMNQPERRYIYSTEILCLLGWLMIFVNLLCRQKSDRRNDQNEKETVP